MTNVVSLYVEVCVFKFENGKAKYLILQRSETEKVYPGIFQFITGAIDNKSDGEPETAVEAAKREMFEEISLQPKIFWVIPIVNSFYVFTRDVVNLSPMFLAEVESNSSPVLSAEHQAYGWYNFEDAIKILAWHGQRQALKKVDDFLTGKDDWGKLTELIT